MWERDSEPSIDQRDFYEFICKFTDVCRKYLEEEYGADMASSMSEPLYYKQAEYKDKKGKKQNVFTLTKQTKFFLCLEKRKKKVLVLLII